MDLFAVCAAISFAFGVLALPHARGGLIFLRWLPLLVLELPTAGYMLWLLLTRPHMLWGWKFELIICLWIAGSILLGWSCAWIVCRRKREE